jgi:hypothetical protein
VLRVGLVLAQGQIVDPFRDLGGRAFDYPL